MKQYSISNLELFYDAAGIIRGRILWRVYSNDLIEAKLMLFKKYLEYGHLPDEVFQINNCYDDIIVLMGDSKNKYLQNYV